MRSQQKNKRIFWYSNETGTTTEEKDAQGNYTGEWSAAYSTPASEYANISANRGNVYEEQFGTSLEYDRVIPECNMNLGINEKTRLWIGIEPDLEKGTVPHNYIVKKVATSLNSVTIAIKKVDVSE